MPGRARRNRLAGGSLDGIEQSLDLVDVQHVWQAPRQPRRRHRRPRVARHPFLAARVAIETSAARRAGWRWTNGRGRARPGARDRPAAGGVMGASSRSVAASERSSHARKSSTAVAICAARVRRTVLCGECAEELVERRVALDHGTTPNDGGAAVILPGAVRPRAGGETSPRFPRRSPLPCVGSIRCADAPLPCSVIAPPPRDERRGAIAPGFGGPPASLDPGTTGSGSGTSAPQRRQSPTSPLRATGPASASWTAPGGSLDVVKSQFG